MRSPRRWSWRPGIPGRFAAAAANFLLPRREPLRHRKETSAPENMDPPGYFQTRDKDAEITSSRRRSNHMHEVIRKKLTNYAYVESFNKRFRNERLNERWFTSLAHVQVVIEAWRREYNAEPPKRALGASVRKAIGRQDGCSNPEL